MHETYFDIDMKESRRIEGGREGERERERERERGGGGRR